MKNKTRKSENLVPQKFQAIQYIRLHGWIKKSQGDNLVIPQYPGWVTSYPPVINGYIKYADFGNSTKTISGIV